MRRNTVNIAPQVESRFVLCQSHGAGKYSLLWPDSNVNSLGKLAAHNYADLRKVAAGMLALQRPLTLSPTGLVHEAFLRLARARQTSWKDRRHFVSACARAMRHQLVDIARRKACIRHGADMRRVPLSEGILAGVNSDRLMQLHDALESLDAIDERQAEIVQLRFFAGLTNQEIAELLGVSRRTIQADWRMARAWLYRELQDETK